MEVIHAPLDEAQIKVNVEPRPPEKPCDALRELFKDIANDDIQRLIADPDQRISLDLMLSIRDIVDRTGLMLTEDQEKLLASRLEMKVDGYREMILGLEKQSSVLIFQAGLVDDEATKYRKAAQSIDRKIKRIEQWAIWNMKNHEWTKLRGEIHNVTLGKRSDVKLNILPTPTSDHFRQWPTLIKRTYKWLKPPLKRAIKADPATFENYGRPVKNDTLTWTINKEPKQ